MNYFNTSLTHLDMFERDNLEEILDNIKIGAAIANERLQEKITEVSKKKKYIKVETPVQWA